MCLSCAIYPSFLDFFPPFLSSLLFQMFHMASSVIITPPLVAIFSSSTYILTSSLIASSFLSLPLSPLFFFIVINLSSGKLGRPVIQIEGVTFGYASKNETKYPSLPLFADVHLGIEQSSRIALVGPNGSGKVRGHYIIRVDVRMFYCSAINLNIFFRK